MVLSDGHVVAGIDHRPFHSQEECEYVLNTAELKENSLYYCIGVRDTRKS